MGLSNLINILFTLSLRLCAFAFKPRFKRKDAKTQRKVVSIISILLFAFAPLAANETSSILFLMQSGNLDLALENYEHTYRQRGWHDHDLLQRMSLILLDQGARSKNAEIVLITLFGAGISKNESVQYILEDAMQNSDPKVQLITMGLLAKFHNDSSDEWMTRAMSSPYLLVRAEAALYLAEMKHPKAYFHIDSLMQKAPKAVLPAFPELFATLGTPSAIRALQRLLINPNQDVRLASIYYAAKFGHDDLLPDIRRLANHHSPSQQEACAAALGDFKDESSVDLLSRLASSSPYPSVRLAAWYSLFLLGREQVNKQIEDLAKQNDLFAINLLGDIPGSEPVLRSLIHHNDIQVRTNAAIALLELRDPACWPALKEILIRDYRDLAFVKTLSDGKSLTAWRVVPSAHHKFEASPEVIELSIRFREAILEETLELPENTFLQIANAIFTTGQDDLVPTNTALLVNLQTTEAVSLLKKHSEQFGAPLIRNYCNLALVKLGEEGFDETLLNWLSSELTHSMIDFRDEPKLESVEKNSSWFHLTPQETSRLLIETFETFSQKRTDHSIDLLLHAIRYGNAKNRYALAGLLILATE